MIFVRADYKIRDSKDLEFVKIIIREFMAEIRANEPNTIMYRSFHEKEDPCRFSHLVGFTDEKAELVHKQTDYNKTFTSKLYPLCADMPNFINFQEVTL
ncbi:putative quinol monooxygenase [Flagellimonas allohymeniacidonis]|uniref:ABM domain-containing protein n=1 Tax=Flagellimonas allohymeniacidonis TaxID=2517819 RepID=A0A4Q8QE07_9FLAO|nr:antibiotic biosynthesis monooxygenase [Allomuricauda hymeniacidonis]TAI47817.1 hypothetical protein EW142_14270 [Allomuricauda hymeniacidonis]